MNDLAAASGSWSRTQYDRIESNSSDGSLLIWSSPSSTRPENASMSSLYLGRLGSGASALESIASSSIAEDVAEALLARFFLRFNSMVAG